MQMANAAVFSPPGLFLGTDSGHSEPETATKSRERRRVALVIRELSGHIDEKIEESKQEVALQVKGLRDLMDSHMQCFSQRFKTVLGILSSGHDFAVQMAGSNDMSNPPVLAWCAMKPGYDQKNQQPEPEESPFKATLFEDNAQEVDDTVPKVLFQGATPASLTSSAAMFDLYGDNDCASERLLGDLYDFSFDAEFASMSKCFMRLHEAVDAYQSLEYVDLGSDFGSNDCQEEARCAADENSSFYANGDVSSISQLISNARDVTQRMHCLRCNTSHTSFCSNGRAEIVDDWSTSTTITVSAVIQYKIHLFILECAGNATSDMMCMFVHNWIVANICRFTFSLEIEGIADGTCIADLDDDAMEFTVIELVSHNGCLHPVGEPCLCSDSEEEG